MISARSSVEFPFTLDSAQLISGHAFLCPREPTSIRKTGRTTIFSRVVDPALLKAAQRRLQECCIWTCHGQVNVHQSLAYYGI